jgi:hypothetical protein
MVGNLMVQRVHQRSPLRLVLLVVTAADPLTASVVGMALAAHGCSVASGRSGSGILARGDGRGRRHDHRADGWLSPPRIPASLEGVRRYLDVRSGTRARDLPGDEDGRARARRRGTAAAFDGGGERVATAGGRLSCASLKLRPVAFGWERRCFNHRCANGNDSRSIVKARYDATTSASNRAVTSSWMVHSCLRDRRRVSIPSSRPSAASNGLRD